VIQFTGRQPVRQPVVAFGVLPEAQAQFVDRQPAGGSLLPVQPVATAAGLQFRQDSPVLGPAFGAAERPQEEVVPPPVDHADGDAGLPLVRFVGIRRWRTLRSAGHAKPPYAEQFRILSGFDAALPNVGRCATTRRKVCNYCSALNLQKWTLQDLNLFTSLVATPTPSTTFASNSFPLNALPSANTWHRVAKILYQVVQHGGTFEAPDFWPTRSTPLAGR